MYLEQNAIEHRKLPSEKEVASKTQQEKNGAEATMNETRTALDKANAKLEMLADRLEDASSDFDRTQSVLSEAQKARLDLENALSVARIDGALAANEFNATNELLRAAQATLSVAVKRVAEAEKALNETLTAISDMEQTAIMAVATDCAEALRDCPSSGTCDFLVENWTNDTADWMTAAPPNWSEIAGDCPQPSTNATAMASATVNTITLLSLVLLTRF